MAAPPVSQLRVPDLCRWGRAIGGGALPSPRPVPQRPGLGGTKLRLDSGTGLGDIGGLPGSWAQQPWAGLASAPLPSSSQTSICLLTSWPPRPFQFPGRSSVGQWEAVTCPAMATGAKGPLLLGRKALVTWEPPGAVTSISEAALGFRRSAHCHPSEQGPSGPSRPQPVEAAVGWLPSCWLRWLAGRPRCGLRPLACTLLSAEGQEEGARAVSSTRGRVAPLHRGGPASHLL